ncbi:polyketide biosynthesis enoyl-CoA hydratase [Caballeronia udeis]|uniref:Polyketide biosynthesis enoyl-CoA hydratase n=1 Tax=Caballeronia udeis TaxID=1232866 RepID=A0A158GL98_9BURK|nr:enoyl-CoA hydratase/isomerase [Caballeronia udeis]SAL32875.1 polyketide biosynthesis enoyl-CoA hydratase [Caballeronia udeis]
MDLLNRVYETVRVRFDEEICFLQIHRPEANNAIDARLVSELTDALIACEASAKIVVLEGLPEVFCSGADFKQIQGRFDGAGDYEEQDPGLLYDLWHRLATGPYISVAHVQGRANAGGIGFVAACDLVLSDDKASFSLSELLFGLMPACVLPFLIRRIGLAKANYMTLTTQPVSARQAKEWGLVDACEENIAGLLRTHLLRLRRLNKQAIVRYKRYACGLADALEAARPMALAANVEVFSDPANLEKISRFVTAGKFPWEGQ